jgi:hypothetical protein
MILQGQLKRTCAVEVGLLLLLVWLQIMERMVEDQPAGDADSEAREACRQKKNELMKDQGARQFMLENGIARQPVCYARHLGWWWFGGEAEAKVLSLLYPKQ